MNNRRHSRSLQDLFFPGDKSTMAMYIENVLLPKQLTDSFYSTWMHCYEELFNATLVQRSSSFKFERNHYSRSSNVRNTSDGIAEGVEKFEMLGDSKTRSLPYDLNRNSELYQVGSQVGAKSGLYSSHKFFPIGKKKTYNIAERQGEVRVISP